MNTTNDESTGAVAAPVDRPVRPDCWGFAMDFLGDPEAALVVEYVATLERWADAAVAAARERCANACRNLPDSATFPEGWGPVAEACADACMKA